MNVVHEIVHLNILTPPAGFRCTCEKCQKPFLEGVAVIEVFIESVPVGLLKADPNPVCPTCGESKHFCMVFASRDEAEHNVQELRLRMEREGFGFLCLIDPAILGPHTWRPN